MTETVLMMMMMMMMNRPVCMCLCVYKKYGGLRGVECGHLVSARTFSAMKDI